MENPVIDNRQHSSFTERRPYAFSFLLLLLLLVVEGGLGFIFTQKMGLTQMNALRYSSVILAVILGFIVSRLKWWHTIGFQKFSQPKQLGLYWPCIAFV